MRRAILSTPQAGPAAGGVRAGLVGLRRAGILRPSDCLGPRPLGSVLDATLSAVPGLLAPDEPPWGVRGQHGLLGRGAAPEARLQTRKVAARRQVAEPLLCDLRCLLPALDPRGPAVLARRPGQVPASALPGALPAGSGLPVAPSGCPAVLRRGGRLPHLAPGVLLRYLESRAEMDGAAALRRR